RHWAVSKVSLEAETVLPRLRSGQARCTSPPGSSVLNMACTVVSAEAGSCNDWADTRRPNHAGAIFKGPCSQGWLTNSLGPPSKTKRHRTGSGKVRRKPFRPTARVARAFHIVPGASVTMTGDDSGIQAMAQRAGRVQSAAAMAAASNSALQA